MPVVNEGLEQELGYIENPDELRHIRSLWDEADPLMQEISHCLIIGKNGDVDRLTRQALDDGFDANTIMDDGLIAGMAVVGIKFRDNIIFVPEVLVAARAMKAGMAYVEPILSASGIAPIGTVVIGTVKGDLHDIGKNLCIMMLRGAGFTVHDLGVDTQPEEFIERSSTRARIFWVCRRSSPPPCPTWERRLRPSRRPGCAVRSASWWAAPRCPRNSPTIWGRTGTAKTP